jgi:hypothetical protein
MQDLVVILLLIPFNYLAPWWIVRRDMSRLSPARLARCWNSASLGSAVLAFGPLCLPVHMVRAHGWLGGMPRAAGWLFATVIAPGYLVDWLVHGGGP